MSTSELICALQGGKTRVASARAHAPLKWLMPKNHGHAAWVFQSSYGGGFVDGDSIEVNVRVAAGATAYVSTQATTKVYRGARGGQQRVQAHVEKNATLVWAPDPVMCFADACFLQRQRFDLADGASLVLIDGLSAGRHEEKWAFARYDSASEICVDGEPVAREALLLDRAHGDLRVRMSQSHAILFALIVGPRFARDAEALVERIAAAPLRTGAELSYAASARTNGVTLLRVAAARMEDALVFLRRELAFISDALGDDPWSRRG